MSKNKFFLYLPIALFVAMISRHGEAVIIIDAINYKKMPVTENNIIDSQRITHSPFLFYATEDHILPTAPPAIPFHRINNYLDFFLDDLIWPEIFSDLPNNTRVIRSMNAEISRDVGDQSRINLGLSYPLNLLDTVSKLANENEPQGLKINGLIYTNGLEALAHRLHGVPFEDREGEMKEEFDSFLFNLSQSIETIRHNWIEKKLKREHLPDRVALASRDLGKAVIDIDLGNDRAEMFLGWDDAKKLIQGTQEEPGPIEEAKALSLFIPSNIYDSIIKDLETLGAGLNDESITLTSPFNKFAAKVNSILDTDIIRRLLGNLGLAKQRIPSPSLTLMLINRVEEKVKSIQGHLTRIRETYSLIKEKVNLPLPRHKNIKFKSGSQEKKGLDFLLKEDGIDRAKIPVRVMSLIRPEQNPSLLSEFVGIPQIQNSLMEYYIMVPGELTIIKRNHSGEKYTVPQIYQSIFSEGKLNLGEPNLIELLKGSTVALNITGADKMGNDEIEIKQIYATGSAPAIEQGKFGHLELRKRLNNKLGIYDVKLYNVEGKFISGMRRSFHPKLKDWLANAKVSLGTEDAVYVLTFFDRSETMERTSAELTTEWAFARLMHIGYKQGVFGREGYLGEPGRKEQEEKEILNNPIPGIISEGLFYVNFEKQAPEPYLELWKALWLIHPDASKGFNRAVSFRKEIK
jgi:hypothetical protein